MGIKLTAKHNWNKSNSQPFFERTFRQNRITIGNHAAAHLRLNGSVVAAEQLVIVDGMVEPIVINCAEGTWLNGETLAPEERRSLRDGDVIHIGTYVINVSVLRNTESENDLSKLFLPNESHQAAAQLTNETGLYDPHRDPEVSSLTLSQSLPAELEASGDSSRSTNTQHSKPIKTFAAILDGLRTDEDRFYFLIEGGVQSGLRVAIENDETPLGLHLTGNHLSFDVESISTMFAIVRKDWSGVLLHPEFRGVTINGEAVDDVRRLRDGDRIAFALKERRVDSAVDLTLIFREPASLVILDSLMPRTSPPEINTSQLVQNNGHIQSSIVRSSVQKFSALFTSNKEYFGVFTFTELSLMAIGTLVGAVIIFLILNYS